MPHLQIALSALLIHCSIVVRGRRINAKAKCATLKDCAMIAYEPRKRG